MKPSPYETYLAVQSATKGRNLPWYQVQLEGIGERWHNYPMLMHRRLWAFRDEAEAEIEHACSTDTTGLYRTWKWRIVECDINGEPYTAV